MRRRLLNCWLGLTLACAAALPQSGSCQDAGPVKIVVPGEVRKLPGGLDGTPVVNSNCPEIVQTEGILVSTFPPEGMKTPHAHLNLALKGRIDVFAHHIAKASSPDDVRTLYLGVLVHNPNKRSVRIQILSGASYDSQPDAPFVRLPPLLPNDDGSVYAGPGDRVVDDVLRDARQAAFPARLLIGPGADEMLLNLPIPVRTLTPPLNGRSALLQLKTDARVFLASMAMYAPAGAAGQERAPAVAEWHKFLVEGALAGPREKEPTVPGVIGDFRYGRVAGVSRGSLWKVKISDIQPHRAGLYVPEPGQSYSYVLSTVEKKTLGADQIQSATLLRRYADTAYSAHGNYAVHYDLTLPFYNPGDSRRTVTLSFETPVKRDKDGLVYSDPPSSRIFFRGTVRLRYRGESRTWQDQYCHLVEKEGERVTPLTSFTFRPKEHKTVRLDFIYPPDATPPQVVTIRTAASPETTGTW